MGREFNPESIPINPNPKSIAIYVDGKFDGVDNERACDLIEQAVNFGIKAWGKQEAMAIQIGAYWLEGWMAANEITDEEANCLRKGIEDFFFI